MSDSKTRNFFRRVRHFQAVSVSLIRYASKSLRCMIAGDTSIPELVRVRELTTHNMLGEVPLTVWEYEQIIEFIKLLRDKILDKNFDGSAVLTSKDLLAFPKQSSDLLEECFVLAAEAVGFNVQKRNQKEVIIYNLHSRYD